MAKPLLVWREPKRVEDQKTRRALSATRRWQIFFVVLVVAVVTYWVFVLHNIFGAMIILAPQIMMFFLRRVRSTYIFEEQGICYETGMSRKRLRWDEIESYTIISHPGQANLRCVLFSPAKVRKKHFIPMFLYDEKIEARVLAILRDKLPNNAIE